MSELVIVYKVPQENVSEILQLLESRNLHPVVVDDIDKMGFYRSHIVRIAVPQTESDMASGILAEAEQRGKKKISELVKKANAAVIIIIALLLLAAIVGFFDEHGKWFFAVWIFITVFVGAALIRRTWGGKSRG
jgi:hypothetical protein